MRRTALVALTGTIIYDGCNDFEMCGGLARFMRSLKIAIAISADYMYTLHGLVEDTNEYNQVECNYDNLFGAIFVTTYDKQSPVIRRCEM